MRCSTAGRKAPALSPVTGTVLQERRGPGGRGLHQGAPEAAYGRSAIGHNRYSTAGSSDLKNAQPIVINFAFGNLALAHNGNLINAEMIRNELEAYGAIFQSTTDSEVIVHLVAHSRASTLLDRVIDALKQVRGAFSITLLTDNGLIAARDPYGFRPLSLGKIRDAWVVASETCAFDLIGARRFATSNPEN